MYSKLYNLWFVDERPRWRLSVGSILIAFGYGIINNMLLGRPEDRVTWETLAVLCIAVFSFTVFYCARNESIQNEREEKVRSWRIGLLPIFVGASAVALVLSAQTGPTLLMYRFNDRLIAMKETVQDAEARDTVLSSSQLAQYKRTVRTVPTSTTEYWATVAAIINYQSHLNQMNGLAPDPAKIAKPCFAPSVSNVAFIGVQFNSCVVYLGANQYHDVLFQNSVIHYDGRPISLTDVTFINCRFVLELTERPTRPAEKDLLLALLDSSDQQNVRVLR
jgi:hypothetical protein